MSQKESFSEPCSGTMSCLNAVCDPPHIAALEDLAQLRQRPVVLYSSSWSFSSGAVTILYDCLRQLGPQEALDVVLQCPGGDPALARRLAVLLRSFTQHLSILVLEQASSSATLLCLAADELLMSPLGCLSPIDPQVVAAVPASSDQGDPAATDVKRVGPHRIATEEVRMFGEMAQAWFGVGVSTEEKYSLLHLFCQRIFPTTLTAFYRADQEMRQVAEELLQYHEPDAAVRQRISDHLISGFASHHHMIHCKEAQSIGLPVRQATAEEERCLWRLLTWSQSYVGGVLVDPAAPGQWLRIRGVLASKGFVAHDVTPTDAPGGSPAVQPEKELTTAPRPVVSGWRRLLPSTSDQT